MPVAICFPPSVKVSSCAGLRSSRSKRSGTSWAMTWPPSCPGALLLSTATQKTTPRSSMKTTGPINSVCHPLLCLSFLSAAFAAYPHSPRGGRGEEKNFKGPEPSLKQPKIYPNASSKGTWISCPCCQAPWASSATAAETPLVLASYCCILKGRKTPKPSAWVPAGCGISP